MSRGIGGYMNLIAADDTMLIYSYCCYNVNNDDWREMQKMEDGEIFIDRAALVEPEIHRKMKRMPINEIDLKDMPLSTRLSVIDDGIRKKYLTRLSEMQIAPIMDLPPLENDLISNVRLYHIKEVAHAKTSEFHESYVSKVLPDCGKYGDEVKFAAEMVPGVSEYNAIVDGDWTAFAIAAGIDIGAIAIGVFTAGAGYAAVKGGSTVAKTGAKVAVKEVAEAGAKKQ